MNLKFIYTISGIVWKISLPVYTVLQLQQFHKVSIMGFAMNVMDGQVKWWNIYYPDSDSTNTLTYFWEHLTRCHDIWVYFPTLSLSSQQKKITGSGILANFNFTQKQTDEFTVWFKI